MSIFSSFRRGRVTPQNDGFSNIEVDRTKKESDKIATFGINHPTRWYRYWVSPVIFKLHLKKENKVNPFEA